MDKIKYRNHTIEIATDEIPANPREWDNLGTFVAFHNRYEMGDKHEFESPEDLHEWIDEQSELVYLAVYMYDHSGISLSTSRYSDTWDSGQVGYIFVTRDKITEEYPNGIDDETIELYLKGEIEIYSQYLNGDVYGYNITGPYCNDACWGIYEDESTIERSTIERAKEEIDATLKHLTTLKKCKLCCSALWTNTVQIVKCYSISN